MKLMIDLAVETPITLESACRHRLLMHDGKPRVFSTLWKWATHGARGVKLETVRVGGSLCTTEQAIQRFIYATSNRPVAVQPAEASQKAHKAAERRLAELGV